MDNLTFEKHYQEIGFLSERKYPNEPMIRFLAEHFLSLARNKRKNVRILEVGCGSGANLWVIAREGFDTYGIDIAPTGIKLCRQMLQSYGVSAKIKVGNMKKLDFKNNYFDAIVDVMSLEHTDLLGHKKAFAEIFRCLKKGGRFFSWHLGKDSVSFKKSGGSKIDKLTVDNIPNTKVPYCNNGITCFLTTEVARKMLTEAGFRDVVIERVERTYKKMTQQIEYFSISASRP